MVFLTNLITENSLPASAWNLSFAKKNHLASVMKNTIPPHITQDAASDGMPLNLHNEEEAHHENIFHKFVPFHPSSRQVWANRTLEVGSLKSICYVYYHVLRRWSYHALQALFFPNFLISFRDEYRGVLTMSHNNLIFFHMDTFIFSRWINWNFSIYLFIYSR